MVMTREHEGVDELLLRLLEKGNLTTFTGVLNMHFRFPAKSQGPWLDLLDERFEKILEQKLLDSEKGQDIRDCIGFCGYVLARERGADEKSKYRLVGAAQMLQNIAWHPSEYLEDVVSHAGRIIGDGNYPLMTVSHAADALKNTAYYPGEHVPALVRTVLGAEAGLLSPRILGAYVRCFVNVAEHSKGTIQNEEARQFLERREHDGNSFTQAKARETYAAIFGQR